MSNNVFFWSNFSKVKMNWGWSSFETFDYKLRECNGSLGLESVYNIILKEKFEIEPKNIIELYSEKNIDLFLSFIEEIISKGEIVVRLQTSVEVPITAEDKKKNISHKFTSTNLIKYLNKNDSKKAIIDIKKRWLKVLESDSYLINQFLMFDVHFALPGGDWEFWLDLKD